MIITTLFYLSLCNLVIILFFNRLRKELKGYQSQIDTAEKKGDFDAAAELYGERAKMSQVMHLKGGKAVLMYLWLLAVASLMFSPFWFVLYFICGLLF